MKPERYDEVQENNGDSEGLVHVLKSGPSAYHRGKEEYPAKIVTNRRGRTQVQWIEILEKASVGPSTPDPGERVIVLPFQSTPKEKASRHVIDPLKEIQS